MRIDLEGKIALITGSAQRVGREIALALAEQGVEHSGALPQLASVTGA